MPYWAIVLSSHHPFVSALRRVGTTRNTKRAFSRRPWLPNGQAVDPSFLSFQPSICPSSLTHTHTQTPGNSHRHHKNPFLNTSFINSSQEFFTSVNTNIHITTCCLCLQVKNSFVILPTLHAKNIWSSSQHTQAPTHTHRDHSHVFLLLLSSQQVSKMQRYLLTVVNGTNKYYSVPRTWVRSLARTWPRSKLQHREWCRCD